MDNKHLHIGRSASCGRTLPSLGLDKKQNIYTSRINSLSCHYYHIASNRTSLQRCKLVMYAYAATCLDNKQRDEDYHSCSACMANMAVFVCQWDLSVCFGRSLPLEFKNVRGCPFYKVSMSVRVYSMSKLPQFAQVHKKKSNIFMFSYNRMRVMGEYWLQRLTYTIIIFVCCSVSMIREPVFSSLNIHKPTAESVFM